ncbi:MAG TPA: VIT1/CCC1 transporter family protein [Candidatus Nanoarchaeia archaeon]|nr:VIT1/CCC1 transporter family protein [Candidatus Nanoarchaeia archaeon]
MEKRRSGKKHHHGDGWQLKNVILGGQDGVVNILGLVLGVAAATQNSGIVIISGLASTFAESLSMAAVAYTSSKAAKEYYVAEVKREEDAVKRNPKSVKKEVRTLFKKRGLTGRALEVVVNKITSSRRLLADTLMHEVSPEEYKSPARNAVVVGFSSLVGSLVPLIPFFFVNVKSSVYWSFVFSVGVLFVTGAYKAKITVGDWRKSGLEMALIGGLAALAGYGIGLVLSAIPY